MTDGVVTGGCACASVRFTISGRPVRAGLCHCLTCRKAHSAAFNPFLVFLREQVALTGELRSWRSSAGYERLFCATCGSRVMSRDTAGVEVELSLGSLDEPGQFAPDYEVWITKREPWLRALPIAQHDQARPEP